MTPIRKRQRAHFYLYSNKKWQNLYIYTQKSRHFPESKIIFVTFYSQKARHFTLRNFHKTIEFGIFI